MIREQPKKNKPKTNPNPAIKKKGIDVGHETERGGTGAATSNQQLTESVG